MARQCTRREIVLLSEHLQQEAAQKFMQMNPADARKETEKIRRIADAIRDNLAFRVATKSSIPLSSDEM